MAPSRWRSTADGRIPMEFMGNLKWIQWVIKRKQQQMGGKLERGWTGIWEELWEGIGDKCDQNHCVHE